VTPYYDDGQVVFWHADIHEVGALSDVACAITSPPYSLGVAYDGYDDWLPDSDYQALAGETWRLISVSLPPAGGRAWTNVGVSRLTVWLEVTRQTGMTERHIVCWEYGIATSDTTCGSGETPSAPHVRHAREPIVCATTGEWRRQAPPEMEHWRNPLGGWANMTRGIWRIPPDESTRTGHPAVTPVALAERSIRLSTWPGEVVADPFAGSDTTLVAANGSAVVRSGWSSPSAIARSRLSGWPSRYCPYPQEWRDGRERAA
jgi:site-specific DNA-methyltransferase (adenine-specific)